jgi:hypothetical protein
MKGLDKPRTQKTEEAYSSETLITAHQIAGSHASVYNSYLILMIIKI